MLGFDLRPLFIIIVANGRLTVHNVSPEIWGINFPSVKTGPHLDKSKGDRGIILRTLTMVIQVKKEKDLKSGVMTGLTLKSIL
jgi:hypothetical protein